MQDLNLKFEEYPFKVPSQKVVVKKLEKIITELEECGSLLTASRVIKRFYKLSDEIQTYISVIYTRYSLETNNKKYKKAQDAMDELGPVLTSYFNKFKKILTSAPYRKDLEKKYSPYLLKKYDADLKSFDEKIIPDLIKENKLVSEYDAILGSAEINFRGEILNLSQLGKYIQDKDRETRKEAAILFDKWIGEHNEKIGQIYDELVHLRDGMAKKLGFKNFIDLAYLRLGRTDYDSKKVKIYRDQIYESVVPLCNKLYKQQMKSLGIKDPQYYDYSLMYKSGNATPKGSPKDIVNAAKKMYSDMSSETKEFFEFMLSHNLMDLEARAGKTTGGYCTYFPLYKAPFIFSNFNGTEGDVNVLCHEGGHAFQGYLSRNFKIPEFRSPTLESCEIHSMSMEFFTWPYMELFFGEDADKYRYSHLCDAIEFLPYGVCVDEFQHWVYENPNKTHKERCTKWRELEQKYTPHKVYDFAPAFAGGSMWIKQSHIIEVPFYYIDYTLAQVCAFQFAVEMHKDKEKAWKKYVKLCKLGGAYPFTGLLEKAKLRNPFEQGNVSKVIKPLTKILKEFDTDKLQ